MHRPPVSQNTKRLDDTLVIFTSDNGFFWGEHGRGDKRMAYEESIRVPLLMRYPKLIAAGSNRPELALNVDIGPTLLDLAGAEIPKTMHGRSLLPLLKGDSGGRRTSVLTEYFAHSHNRIPSRQSVRTRRWKYVRYVGPGLDGMDELYDLEADRAEMRNLAGEPSAAATVAELRIELERLLSETK